MKQFRQGDVWIEEVSSVAGDPVEDKEVVLAYGEVTGHRHRTNPAQRGRVKAYRKGPDLFLDIAESRGRSRGRAVRVIHEEHGPIPLPPGKYVSWTQMEYSPAEIRNVAD